MQFCDSIKKKSIKNQIEPQLSKQIFHQMSCAFHGSILSSLPPFFNHWDVRKNKCVLLPYLPTWLSNASVNAFSLESEGDHLAGVNLWKSYFILSLGMADWRERGCKRFLLFYSFYTQWSCKSLSSGLLYNVRDLPSQVPVVPLCMLWMSSSKASGTATKTSYWPGGTT